MLSTTGSTATFKNMIMGVESTRMFATEPDSIQVPPRVILERS